MQTPPPLSDLPIKPPTTRARKTPLQMVNFQSSSTTLPPAFFDPRILQQTVQQTLLSSHLPLQQTRLQQTLQQIQSAAQQLQYVTMLLQTGVQAQQQQHGPTIDSTGFLTQISRAAFSDANYTGANDHSAVPSIQFIPAQTTLTKSQRKKENRRMREAMMQPVYSATGFKYEPPRQSQTKSAKRKLKKQLKKQETQSRKRARDICRTLNTLAHQEPRAWELEGREPLHWVANPPRPIKQERKAQQSHDDYVGINRGRIKEKSLDMEELKRREAKTEGRLKEHRPVKMEIVPCIKPEPVD